MKKVKTAAALLCSACLVLSGTAVPTMADSVKVVTLGADLTQDQKNTMMKYFNVDSNQVQILTITNQDERDHLSAYVPLEQIGTRTVSCAYVKPTQSGGIKVRTANLNWVTGNMIATSLSTSGVKNCEVIAACPMEVSGTGALTGIMMAYEKASGKELSEDQKATATEELVTTGDLAKDLGQDTASDLINDVKESVIEDKLTDPSDIQDAISDAADKQGITLTDDQLAKITSLMESISQYDYDVKALKKTLDNLDGKSGGFFSNLWSSIKGFFGGDDSNGGIINNTDDAALGNDAIIDSTLDAVKSKANDAVNQAKEEGLWDKIVGFFKDLFGGDDTENSDNTDSTDAVEENTDNNTDTGSTDNNADNDTSTNAE